MDLSSTYRLLVGIIRPESGFLYVVMVYGIAISLLTLAVPIAVQTLINTVANIASTRAVIILALALFTTLFLSSVLSALRTRVMEYYERRVYARLTSILSFKILNASHSFFDGRRNTALSQRYFEIMILQKNVPSLMVDGFALVLQMLVGFTLVSFYHPVLFAFNIMILLTMYVIWKLFSGPAKRSAIELSNAKHASAKWLTDIATAHEFFKSSRHIDYAAENTEAHIAHYIAKHKHHFVFTFAQTVLFLLLYASASAALLGLGGWLVVLGELSIGQLVAAELIMSAVFFGLSRFTVYLNLYYELYGAADKIGKALLIPQETKQTLADKEARQSSLNSSMNHSISSSLYCHNLVITHQGKHCQINLSLDAGSKAIVSTTQSWIQHQFINLLKYYENEHTGRILLGDLEFSDYDAYQLRQMIITIDRSLIIDCSIKDYLRMFAPQATMADITNVLTQLSLDETIDALPQQLNTRISPLGKPLQSAEMLMLKLAAAILAKPKMLIINQHFDALPSPLRQQLIELIATQPFSVLYFSSHQMPDVFDTHIKLSASDEPLPRSKASVQGEII
ncbi:MAG: ABC transporter ATP-binding protein [Gammaproteobacteria bacterium]|nr:MAG: ABC transporter ATP-binding protein [Gammaproteobacteria bacterium]